MSRPNVVLLSVDALRADHLGCHGYARDTTPTLDRLARSGLQFRAAYSASSHTREAIPALLTGRYPDACVDDDYHLAAETVASLLAETPYATGAFHSNPFVSRGYGYGGDFDAFFDDLKLGSHKLLALVQRAFDRLRNRHYAPATEINERALSWLDSVESPFFLWNHYMDPHGPYDPPAEHARSYFGEATSTKRAQRLYWRGIKEPESITDAERSEMIDLYDGEIEYVDAQIGSFLDALAARDLLEGTLVIVTADHGDAFGEHGYYGHPRQLDDELLHVPMVVSGPDVPERTVDAHVSTLDVVPTALATAGVDGVDLPGESLLEVAGAAGGAGGGAGAAGGATDGTGTPARTDDGSRTADWPADRRVYAQARGQKRKDETHLRRFVVRTATGRCWIEREIESGNVTGGPEGEEALAADLRAFSADRIGTQRRGEGRGGSDANSEVERRLEALGYK